MPLPDTYCPACAEQVPPSVDSSGTVARCSKCGLGLGPIRRSAAELPEAEIEVILPLEEVVPDPLYDTVLVAEDTRLFSQILRDGLVGENLARHVFVGDNGEEFLALYAEQLYADRAVDLAIIDLEMPVLDGASTAIAMRALETGVRGRKTPILFFTAHPVNDALRQVMRHCKPAHYLNKGADAQPERIIKRVREVMRGLQL